MSATLARAGRVVPEVNAPPRGLLSVLLAAILGAAAAAAALTVWLPGLAVSMAGPTPRAFWYLSRASALVGFVLLWLSVVMGLLMSNRLARLWPGGPLAFDLHAFTSLLGLTFAVFHALILLGDRYVAYSLASLLVPFASAAYRPVWIGLGQAALYLLVLVTASFYVRRFIGQRTWRQIHFLTFVVFVLVLAHGVTSGTETGTPWARLLYWGSAGSVLYLATYRLLGLSARACTLIANSRHPSAASAGTAAREAGRSRESTTGARTGCPANTAA